MKTTKIIMIGVIMALLLATSVTQVAFADDEVVPFKAYYPVEASLAPGENCGGCMVQTFIPGGNGSATHMGVSLFSGTANAWFYPSISQKGWGELTAANGDTLTVYYESTNVAVIDEGRHFITDGWYVVTGGTGRFNGATGGGTYRVFVYVDGSQPNDLWFEGELHK